MASVIRGKGVIMTSPGPPFVFTAPPLATFVIYPEKLVAGAVFDELGLFDPTMRVNPV
jgi:hypothetical protein